jgi:endo-1,4-beta-xylanase
MTSRRTAAAAVVGAALVAVVALVGVGRAPADGGTGPRPAGPTLRELGRRAGLPIGTAVDMAALEDSTDPDYRRLVASEFSTVTPEDVMKWEVLEPIRGTYDWSRADRLVAVARADGQRVRGHVLVWDRQLPSWLTGGVADGTIGTTELRQLLRRHVTDVVAHFKGAIWQWDVVNEAVSDPGQERVGYQGFWAEHLGPGYVADAFGWARGADPDALLFYNDYGIETFAAGDGSDKALFVHGMVRDLRARQVPIDGVGFQGHLGTQYGAVDSARVSQTLDRFADLGVATAFTEVDVRSPLTAGLAAGDRPEVDRALQASAAAYGALLQVCLQSRSCLSFTVWGFTDRHSWVPGWFRDPPQGLATIHDAQYRRKPAYEALRAVLLDAGSAARSSGSSGGVPSRPRTPSAALAARNKNRSAPARAASWTPTGTCTPSGVRTSPAGNESAGTPSTDSRVQDRIQSV